MKTKRKFISRVTGMVLVVCLLAGTILSVNAEGSSMFNTLLSRAAGAESLMAGAAVRDITPTPEMYPLERKAAGDLVGVIDPLHVRVIALDDGTDISLLVSTETGRGPYGPQYIPLLSEATDVAEENIFLTATHSHAAPEITSTIDLDGTDNYAKWGRLVRDQMIDAANEAIETMEPAEVGIGYAESYTNANRNATYTQADGSTSRDLGYNGGGVSDKDIATIQFRHTGDGSTIAFIVNTASHGVVMHANEYFAPDYEGVNFELYDPDIHSATEYEYNVKYCEGVLGVSSDLPGYVSTYLESSYEGSVALYLCGAAGDQNPIAMNEIYLPHPETGAATTTHIAGGSVAILEYLAKYQYADALSAINAIESFDANVSISHGLDSTELPGRGNSDVTMYLQLLRIGDIALVGTTGEFFASIGMYMKENSDLSDTLIVNCCWNRVERSASYYTDDDGIINGGNGTSAQYEIGTVNPYMTALMNDLIGRTN